MMRKKKIYYAHSLDIYDAPIEKEDIKFLEKEGIVINPNSEELECGNKMIAYIYVIKDCDAVYYRGKTWGIAFEVLSALAFKKPVYSLETKAEITQEQIRELITIFNGSRYKEKDLELFRKHFPRYYKKLLEIIESKSHVE